MANTLYDLVVNITANTAGLVDGLAGAARAVSTTGTQITGAMKGAQASIEAVGTAIKTIGAFTIAGFGVHQIESWSDGVIKAASSVQDLAQATGSSVESVSKLANQAKVAGADFGTLQGAMFQLNKRLAESKDSTSDAARALQYLKVSASDPAEAFQQVVQAMAQYEGGIGKAALATALFGKNGQEFLATLDNMAKLGQVQATISRQQAEEAERFEIQLRLLTVQSNTLASALLSNVIPALNDVIAKFIAARAAGFGFYDSYVIGFQKAQATQRDIDSLRESIANYQRQVERITKDQQGRTFIFPEEITTLKSAQEEVGKLTDKLNSLLTVQKSIREASTRALGYIGDARDQALGTSAASTSPQQANFSLKDKLGGIDDAARALERFRGMVAVANAELAALGSGEKFTPIQRAFADLQASDVWKRLPADIQRTIAALTQMGAATQHTIDLETRFSALVAQLDGAAEGFGKDWAASFGTLTEKFNAGTLSLERYRELTEILLQQQPFFKKQQEAADAYVKSVIAGIDALSKLQAQAQVGLAEYTERTRRQEQENSLIGLSEDARAQALVALDAQVERQRILNAQAYELLPALDAEVARRQEAVSAQIRLTEQVRALQQTFADLANAGANFIVDFAEHGTSAFKNLWSNFKHWALEAFAEIAAKQIVVSIAGSFSGGLGSVASTALGSTGIFGQVGSALGAGGSLLGGGLGIGDAIGNLGTIIPTLMETGSFTAAFSGMAASFAAVAPWAALAAIAIPLVVRAFDDGPANRTAQFGSGAGLGAGNPLFRSSSALGSFGIFNDKWFSDKDQGKQIQDFLAGLTSIDNALANMVGPDTVQRIQERLADLTTTFSAGMEHEATDFGSIMKDRYHAVLELIDPELGKLAAAFTGTGDQLAKFVVDVVGVFETLKTIDTQSLFGQSVSVTDIAGLTRAGDSVADTFKNLVTVFTLTDQIALALGRDMTTAFGQAGLAGAAAREQFINLLGGSSQAGGVVSNYLQTAFTDTERQSLQSAQALATLNTVFSGLGRAVPNTWAELNTLIHSFDLTTDDGQEMTATFLTRVVPAFAAVHGTAQDAADALQQAAAALEQAHQSATQFFNSNFLSADEQQAQNLSTVADAAAQFNVQIPTTVAGFHDFIIGLRSTGDAGSQLADTIVNDVGQAIVDLNRSTGTLANSANAAADAITNMNQAITTPAGQAQPAVDLVQAQLDLIGNVTKDIGARLTAQLGFLGGRIRDQDAALAQALPGSSEANRINATLNSLRATNAGLAADLAQYVSLRAQYGAEQAGQLLDLQHWHDANLALFDRSPDELASFETLFHQQWQAILNGTADDLKKFFDRIHDYVKQLTTSDLSPLSPTEKFTEAQRQFRDDILLAQAGNAEALNRVTTEADTYLRLSRDISASGGQTTAVFDEIVNSLTGLDTGTGTNVNATIAAAMPSGSTVLSQADGQQISADITGELASMKQIMAQLLTRLSDDSQDIVDAVNGAKRSIDNQPALTARA